MFGSHRFHMQWLGGVGQAAPRCALDRRRRGAYRIERVALAKFEGLPLPSARPRRTPPRQETAATSGSAPSGADKIENRQGRQAKAPPAIFPRSARRPLSALLAELSPVTVGRAESARSSSGTLHLN